MKKSILALLLAVLMVASLLPAAAMADGTPLTVGENETYTTIGAAVAAASSGDTIYIKNGTYAETVTINDKALTLKGESQNGVTIQFVYESRNQTATFNGTQCYPIVSSNSNLTLQDLTIAGPTARHHGIGGVLATAGLTMSNVTVKDIRCTADNAEVCGVQYGRGIMVDGSGDVSITNCKVIDFQKNAIDVNTTGKVVINNNIIEGVGSQAIIAQNGIVARKGDVTITNNEISGLSYTADNEWKYGSVGVYPLEGVTALTITGNDIDSVDSALYVYEVKQEVLDEATIENNTVTNPPAPVSNETQGTLYDTLQEAMEAAVTGDTIKLNKNIEVSSAITVPAGVTIDGDDHSITSAEGYSGYIINLNNADSKNITLKNLVLDGNNYNGPILKVPQTSDISGFTANAVVFRNAKHGVYISNENKNNVSANNIQFVNCDFEDLTYAGIYAQRGNITVSDGCYFYNINAPEGETAAGILMDTFYFGDKAYTLSVTDSEFTNIVGTTSSEKATGAVSFTGSGTVSKFTMTGNRFSGNTIDLRIGKDTAPTFTETVISNNGNIKVVTASNAKIYTAAFYSDNSLYETIVTDGTVTMPAIRKSGYAFLGWVSGGKTYLAGETVTITADTTFTASWVRHPDTEYVPEPEQPVEPEVPAFPFYDVPTSAWYYTAVKYVYDNKLMDGVDTYVFAPNDTLTRAMVWTIIARMSGVDTTGGNTWYAKAQEWVITNGISDGENPTAAITRQELVTMLYRYAQIKGYDVSVGENTNILSYVDATSISEYAVAAFQWSCGSGLTEGDENGALTPLATATRAQAAAMIMRFLSK